VAEALLVALKLNPAHNAAKIALTVPAC